MFTTLVHDETLEMGNNFLVVMIPVVIVLLSKCEIYLDFTPMFIPHLVMYPYLVIQSLIFSAHILKNNYVTNKMFQKEDPYLAIQTLISMAHIIKQITTDKNVPKRKRIYFNRDMFYMSLFSSRQVP